MRKSLLSPSLVHLLRETEGNRAQEAQRKRRRRTDRGTTIKERENARIATGEIARRPKQFSLSLSLSRRASSIE